MLKECINKKTPNSILLYLLKDSSRLSFSKCVTGHLAPPPSCSLVNIDYVPKVAIKVFSLI